MGKRQASRILVMFFILIAVVIPWVCSLHENSLSCECNIFILSTACRFYFKSKFAKKLLLKILLKIGIKDKIGREGKPCLIIFCDLD